MTPEKWREVQAMFAAALETPVDVRDQRLRELCGGDDELYREVSTMLAADADASAVIRSPAAGLPDEATEARVPVGVRAGEYEIRGLLGRGGMGTVYAGIHPVIEKEVAIKVLDPRLAANDGIVDRFVQEARAVNKIRHPNIIDIFAFGRSPELGHYFVMPRLIGETLGARIERRPFSLDELLPILEQITDALDAAHGAGILHRDLKPDNVFLVAERRGGVHVQILDFGIAKLLDGATSVTRSGMQMGTPLFMSPEQWDAGDVDRRTDVYALGVLIHYALTGRFPFESSSPVALMNMHANQPPTPASQHGAAPAVDPVIARALAKSRDDRPASARELLAELVAIAGESFAPAPAPRPPVSTTVPAITTLSGSASVSDRPASARGRFGLALLGLTAIGAVIVATAFSVGRRDDKPAPAGETSVTATEDASVPVDAAEPTPLATVDASSPAEETPPTPRPRADARVNRPRTTGDAVPVPRDAAVAPVDTAPRRADAGGWGTTINPFPDRP